MVEKKNFKKLQAKTACKTLSKNLLKKIKNNFLINFNDSIQKSICTVEFFLGKKNYFNWS